MHDRRLYVENNVGKRFVRAFNQFTPNHGWTAVIQHEVHPEMQRPQTDDVWWIEEVAREGFALVTCDLAIVTTNIEREAVRGSGARLLAFASAQYSGWQQMRALTTHWDVIENEFEQGGPVILKVYAGPTKPSVERL